MHLELVELLRCPVLHPATVLVAAADRIVSRYITDGVLGCPECGAEYAIRGGVTYFAHADNVHRSVSGNAATGSPVAPDVAQAHVRPDAVAGAEVFDLDSVALRVAAQLGMTEGRTAYALLGYSAAVAVGLRRFVPARVLLLNPPQGLTVDDIEPLIAAAPVGVIVSPQHLPFVPSKLDGLAFASAPSTAMLVDATRVLRPGGRLVAPVECALPPETRELVRDRQVWVAEREAVATAPVGITRRP